MKYSIEIYDYVESYNCKTEDKSRAEMFLNLVDDLVIRKYSSVKVDMNLLNDFKGDEK